MPSPTLEAAIGGDLEETTSTTPDQVHQLVEQARGAQSVFETFSQEQVDAIVRDFGKYVYDNAEAVAAMAHKETGLGVYEDKVLKAQSKARVIWNNLKGKKSRGIIGEDAEQNLVLIAKPMGVVGAVLSATAMSWQGILLSKTARLAPAGSAGAVTGGVLSFGQIGALLGPFAFSLLLRLTGGYTAGWALCTIPAFWVGISLLRQPAPLEHDKALTAKTAGL